MSNQVTDNTELRERLTLCPIFNGPERIAEYMDIWNETQDVVRTSGTIQAPHTFIVKIFE